jgi:hypothetical protein
MAQMSYFTLLARFSVVQSVLVVARGHVLDDGRHRPAVVLVVLARVLVRALGLARDPAAEIASPPKPLRAPLVAP